MLLACSGVHLMPRLCCTWSEAMICSNGAHSATARSIIGMMFHTQAPADSQRQGHVHPVLIRKDGQEVVFSREIVPSGECGLSASALASTSHGQTRWSPHVRDAQASRSCTACPSAAHVNGMCKCHLAQHLEATREAAP